MIKRKHSNIYTIKIFDNHENIEAWKFIFNVMYQSNMAKVRLSGVTLMARTKLFMAKWHELSEFEQDMIVSVKWMDITGIINTLDIPQFMVSCV